MNNEFLDLEPLELKPVELQGNGIMGNGISCPLNEINFDNFLNDLEI